MIVVVVWCFVVGEVRKKERTAISNHRVAITVLYELIMGNLTALMAITTPNRPAPFVMRAFISSKVVTPRQFNWVEAPLAYLRSAGEVASNPSITLI